MLWLQLRKLKGGDSEARARAAHALAERGNAKAVQPLGEALQDRQWPDRAAAAVALGKLGNGRGVAFLASALGDDPEVDVRCSSAWALGSIGGRGVLESLTLALDDENEAVRRVATEALTEVGTAMVLQSLVKALADNHCDVRLAAIRGLGALRSGAAAPHLLGVLTDDEWSVRTAAATAVTQLEDSTAVPALLATLEEPASPAAHLACVEALGRIGDPRAVPGLAALISGEGRLDGASGCDLRLRRGVAKALGDIGKAEGIPPLRSLLADRFTAGAAVEALVRALRWDAAQAEDVDLEALAETGDVSQAPWMIDEAVEASSGRIVVREGKQWAVDTTEMAALVADELRHRQKESHA